MIIKSKTTFFAMLLTAGGFALLGICPGCFRRSQGESSRRWPAEHKFDGHSLGRQCGAQYNTMKSEQKCSHHDAG
jgi:hypothetical protein